MHADDETTEEYEPCYKDSLAFEWYREHETHKRPIEEMPAFTIKNKMKRLGRYTAVNYMKDKDNG